MPAAPTPNPVTIILLGVVAWRVVARVRRSIGRQPLGRKRLIFRLAIYSLVTVLLATASILLGADKGVFLGLAAGLGAGAVAGWWGLRLTQFESTPEGQFYTPNRYMGAAVSVLFLGRLAYRYTALYAGAAHSPDQASQVLSPLTLLFFGLLAGYYLVYFIGLLMRSRAKPTDN